MGARKTEKLKKLSGPDFFLYGKSGVSGNLNVGRPEDFYF